MENLMEALRVIAGSWPIAVMVVGVTTGFFVRRTLYQTINNAHLEKLEQYNGNRAVVVGARQRDNAG
jgi:hypothetical protein